MKSNGKQHKHSVFYRVTLFIALAFLVIGLAFLGSFRTTGGAFELKAKSESDADTPSVIFRLSDLTEESDGQTQTTKLRVVAVYANVGAAYQSVGQNATLRIDWATSASSSFNASSRRSDMVVENFAAEEGAEDVGTEQLFSWGEFASVGEKWTVSDYSYVRLTARTCNLLVNEVSFVGEKLDADGEGTGELCLVPAEVYSATPLVGQTAEEAASAAGALLDRQNYIPSASDYRFNAYSAGERAALATIAEMRLGGAYGEGNIYEGERVYGSLGVDILALGTAIFGMSPFGLRFFPMLAAFGALLVGASFVRQYAGSDKAGMIFAILFALASMTLSFGGLGTPLMIGVFFLLASVNLCHRFYARGMKKAGFTSALPLILSGLSAACAVCVHGAFVIPAIGVALLFAAGMVRQYRARRYYLDKAIAAAETEESAPAPAQATEEEELSPAKRKVAEVVSEYRYKNAAAIASFAASFVIGALVIALLAILPSYFAYVKLYDNPAAPARNIFSLMWKVFAGGFVGVNAGVPQGSAWNIFAVISRTGGEAYASVWGAFVNPVCLLALVFAVGYCIWRIVCLMRSKEWGKSERKITRELAIPLVGALLSAIAAIAAQEAYAFVALVYLFAFALVSDGAAALSEREGRFGKVVRVCLWAAFGLLAAMFVLYFAFATGLPLPASLIARLFG